MKACFTLLTRVDRKFVTVEFKKGCAIVPEGAGSFYIRFTRDGKRHTKAVGKDLKRATQLLYNMEKADAYGLDLPEAKQEPDTDPRLTLKQARDKYFNDRKHLDAKSISAYRVSIDGFIASCKKTHVDDIDTQDMIDYRDWLATGPAPKRKHGNPNRTQKNKMRNVVIFLNAFGKDKLVKRGMYPKFHPKKVKAHIDEELTLLYSHADSEERFLLDFFIGTMLRDTEGGTCRYEQLTGTTLTVYGKQDKTRTVEISPLLADKIARRREANPSEYLFPNRDGKASTGLLRKLQTLAKRAGAKFHTEMHKLRKTGASRRYAAGVPLMTLMKELGHSSLNITQIYLEDVATEDTKRSVAAADFIPKPKIVRTGTSGD